LTGFPDDHADLGDGEPEEDGPSLAWELDNVVLLTVGVDIGSSTSHLLFSRLHLQRLAQALSSRFVVVGRQIVSRSPILLTPFRKDGLIDAAALERFVTAAYGEVGLSPADVDTGAVILTGLAVERANARAVADLFARVCGGFVCASAGHNLEAALAAHGSGAARLSRERPGQLILHIDVGGGTSKLALVRDGAVLATAAIACGGRLVTLDGAGRVLRVEPPARRLASRAGVELAPGRPIDGARLGRAMADAIASAARGEVDDLLLTEPLPGLGALDAVTFSGGVAEYIHGREADRFGDIAPELGTALASAAAEGCFGAQPVALDTGIRATVIGASQFTVQLSGSTVHVSDRSLLPLRNVPVVDARLPAERALDGDAVRDAVRAGLRRLDLEEGAQPVAVALCWTGEPRYAHLRAVAGGLAAALPRTLAADVPLVLALDADVGRSLGSILAEEFAAARVASLDGVDVRELDFVDVGEPIEPAGVVPVVVKSLAFGAGGPA
jgi:ethanolamine utilization protein EutA